MRLGYKIKLKNIMNIKIKINAQPQPHFIFPNKKSSQNPQLLHIV